MPIVHGNGLSPYVRKVRFFLAEKGVDYDHDPLLPFPKTPELLAKSPLGKIPFYEDGDLVVPDSSA